MAPKQAPERAARSRSRDERITMIMMGGVVNEAAVAPVIKNILNDTGADNYQKINKLHELVGGMVIEDADLTTGFEKMDEMFAEAEIGTDDIAGRIEWCLSCIQLAVDNEQDDHDLLALAIAYTSYLHNKHPQVFNARGAQ